MTIKVVLVDVNAKMVAAWKEVFEGNPEVDVVLGSMTDQKVSAWVNPTNSRAEMAGGLDGVIKKHFGPKIQTKIQSEIAKVFTKGILPVGHATCVETGHAIPRFLISTPTMHGTSDNVSDTLNVALAASAALTRAQMQNAKEPGSITSIALPGLGANTGKVPVEICADLMWTAYNLFRSRDFTSFDEMRTALEEELGSLGNELSAQGNTAAKPTPATMASATPNHHGTLPKGPVVPAAAKPAAAPVAPPAKTLGDFDDHD